MFEKGHFPLYIQLRETLRRQITEGRYVAHDELPSEPQMVQIFQVSRATVRRALDDLEREGLIERERGRGTFVAPTRPLHDLLNELSLAKELRARGMSPRSIVLDFGVTHAAEAIAKQLHLAAGAQVVMIKRLRFADDEPLLIETAYLPAKVVPGLSQSELEDGVLYDLLGDRYGLVVGRYDTEIVAVMLSKEEGDLLKTGTLVPGLMVRRTVCDIHKMPWVVSQRVIRGDRCTYLVKAD